MPDMRWFRSGALVAAAEQWADQHSSLADRAVQDVWRFWLGRGYPMSVEGLRFRWRDEGTIAGTAVALTAGDPVPAFPLTETLGPFAIEVAAAATVTLWQASASPLTAFDYLYVMAGAYPTVDGLADDGTTPELAGQLELTCDDGASERIWFEQLRASFPYRRFSNAGLNASDEANVIDLIRYENTTEDDLIVRFFLARA
jgi:hypothetical protein